MSKPTNIPFFKLSDFLHQALQKPFPGKAAHAKMSPSGGMQQQKYNVKKAKKCGVLILMYPKNQKPYFALIKRTDTLQYHSGQISLPGGKMDISDTDITQTALRETFEELGVQSSEIQVVGSLSPVYIEVSKFLVFPSMGILPKKPVFNICKSEVSELIEVNMNDFFSDENRKVQTMNWEGEERDTPYYQTGKHIVWGATAKILSEFEMLLKQ